MNEKQLLNMSDFDKKKYILKKDDLGKYILNEEERIKLLDYIENENKVYEVAKTLSDSNKIKENILLKFKKNSSNLIKLLKTIENIEYLKKGLEYCNDDYYKVELITDDKYNDQDRLELIKLISKENYRMKVINSIKEDKLLKESLKYFNNEYNQAQIINKIQDINLKLELATKKIDLIKDVYKIKIFISFFSSDQQVYLLSKLNNLLEIENEMVNIDDFHEFNIKFMKIESYGLKYRILLNSNKKITDEFKLMFLKEFEEEDRLAIILNMSDDEYKIIGYNQKPFNDEQNRMKYIKSISDENKINQLYILNNDIDKLIIINEIKNKDLRERALEKISNYQIIFKKIFEEGIYNLISNFDNSILTSIFDSKQVKILNEYNKYTRENVKKHFCKYVREHYNDLNEEEIATISELIFRIDTSNSDEISKQADSFLTNILSTKSSMISFEKIEKIFLKNHLPYFAKVYLTFQTVHPNFNSYSFCNKKDGKHSVASPVLNNASLLHKKVVVLSDLIKCSLGSNNLDFLNYLNKLEYCNELYIKYKDNPGLSISNTDKQILQEFRDSLFTIYDNSLFSKLISESENVIEDIKKIDDVFSKIYGNSITLADRIIGSYCHFIGINSINDAREYVYDQITKANKVNQKRFKDNDFKIEKGDFIKSFDINYFFQMMQNGIVAKDYLGADMTTDFTALDTDLSRIHKDTENMSIQEIIDLKNKDSGYFGQAYIVIKDDPAKIRITKKSKKELDSRCDVLQKKQMFENKLETFSTGEDGSISIPYGIRTGFPSSQISFIVFDEKGGIYSNNIYKLILPIVMSGIYIPIISKDNEKVLFTLDEYKKLRRRMNGLNHYNMYDYTISNNLDSPEYIKLINEIEFSTEIVAETKNKINKLIKEALDNKFKIVTHINGKLTNDELQILDIGSTGRETNLLYDSDFDYIIRINRDIDIDEKKKMNFIKKIISKFDIVDSGKIVNGDIKGMIINIEGKNYKLDLSFTQKTDKISYSSEMCVSDRLNTIKKQHPEKYKLVLANIIYAKQLFKNNDCYKKGNYGQGGLGGIGVENWILQNGGSLYDASIDFLSSALSDDGKIIPFDDFKNKYYIWDFGENFYTDRKNQKYNYNDNLHDNFINNLTEEGYLKICNVLKKFVSNYKNNVNQKGLTR